ncbi:uncharacterized protein C8A04DRAFT_25448 [Dichotomopilus funicola]|uniref:Uncharacterized protein n=1 Tax=Dichotomopilus funicola TaxID=1934379 RepID=A0AAN6V9D0_9PEZI|nr:hypothetical protein C8A04DRAFT_25448 [Dichotomopilus funicola]
MTNPGREPIALVGSGCRFPGGAHSPSSLWRLLAEPRDVCRDIPASRFDTRGFYHPDGTHHGSTNVLRSYLLERDDDLRTFDAGFFNISPHEAESMDPQQRLLLETVYEALEAGGHTIDALRGSDTAVYVGTMGVDYYDTLVRDLQTLPTYFATGTNRAILSNRVSYFFDWHGPSMTIDTACSSSLIAVHQGVQALRSGESRVAVACGTQVLLNPEMYVAESKMKMLSPTGRSRMWDAGADGYARGEGVAAIVMKRLSDAIADGDAIECVIRETGANQDGFSNGITVPSTEAQAALIRQTYARAGLNPEQNLKDRPQFFEAHGTGTQAGDPKEAAAIAGVFSPQSLGEGDNNDTKTPLYVGSVKTVIGHLEGAAGLAGLLKSARMIRAGVIVPNLLFETLNPAIEPYYRGLCVPTATTAWPALEEGVPRRVSVNSFGFGGCNAHAILEEYQPTTQPSPSSSSSIAFTPFTFSAISEASLVAQLRAYQSHLSTHPEINPADLAWTLQTRRTEFPIKAAFSATTIDRLAAKLDTKLAAVDASPEATVGTRTTTTGAPRILGVFTGQGAQWATMLAQLIHTSPFVRARLAELDTSLATLPDAADRPTWTLASQLLAEGTASRLSEAALSQPLCTAVQIVLVDLLRAAGISFSAVVGHSSGEIAAAYTAGFLSAHDAIRVAYYRGVHARLAGNPSGNGQKGAMLAVGASWEEAQDLVNSEEFKGRLAIAAHNSPASVTLSGDEDAILLAKQALDATKTFARLLKVDTAYHSQHMIPCGEAYVASLRAAGVSVLPGDENVKWFSSVNPNSVPVKGSDALKDLYWRDNMANSVLFTDAVRNALASDEQLGLAIEVGPHPALKGPATQIVADVRPSTIPYTGVLSRGADDVEAFGDALGFLWTQLGSKSVNLQAVHNLLQGTDTPQTHQLVLDLPTYQWNHDRSYWGESRASKLDMRHRSQPPHELLGVPSAESTPQDLRWTNVLKAGEIPWLDGHQLQGQTVFPAAGYVTMALEAARVAARANPDKEVEVLEVHDLAIPKAITFDEADSAGVETLVTLTGVRYSAEDNSTTADFSCYALPVSTAAAVLDERSMERMAHGSVKIVYGQPDANALPCVAPEEYNMAAVDTDAFYTTLRKLGYGYDGAFRSVSGLKRRLDAAVVKADSYDYTDPAAGAGPQWTAETVYLVHPSTLDIAFQTTMLAYSAPGDGRLWSLHVPTAMRTVRVNPAVAATVPLGKTPIPVSAVIENDITTAGAAGPGDGFAASIELLSPDGQHGLMQVDGFVIQPFAPASAADDRAVFRYTKLDVAVPDGNLVVGNTRPSAADTELGILCERVSYYYIRKWNDELAEADWESGQPHHLSLRDWVIYTVTSAARGHHPTMKPEWAADTHEQIHALMAKFPDSVDLKLLRAVGEHIPASVRGETTILEHMLKDNVLDDFYKYGLGFPRYNAFLAGVARQIAHRTPRANVLEIGAGTGGATKSVLAAIGDSVSAYTYTDISVGFFNNAAEMFKQYAAKMVFKTLDIEKDTTAQGYVDQSFDLIIASNVLHATVSLHATLENTRRLLKPGGYLLLLEITNQGPTRFGNVMAGLSGWWLGAPDGRKYAPTVTPGRWHSALRKAGFSGVDSITPDVGGVAWPCSIMATQAVDDRVQFLRRPLALPATSAATVHFESLVVVGAQTLDTARIVETLTEHLSRFAAQVTVLPTLPTEDEAEEYITPLTTVILLADLDAPLFRNMTASLSATEETLAGLQRVLDRAGTVLWLTRGAHVDEPFHGSSVAFMRSVRSEAPHLGLYSVDVHKELEDRVVGRVVAEYVLRSTALSEWEDGIEQDTEGGSNILWPREFEVVVDAQGRLTLPRLIAHKGQNARHNAGRRAVTKSVAGPVALAWKGGKPVLVASQRLASTTEDRVKVVSSSVSAVRVAEDTFLFVGTGTGKHGDVAFLSTTNASEVVPLVSTPLAGASTNTPAIISALLAASILSEIPASQSLLVLANLANTSLATALIQLASAQNIRVTVAVDALQVFEDDVDPDWVRISPRASRHALRGVLKSAGGVTHFLDLTTREVPSALGHLLRGVLGGVKGVELGGFVRNASGVGSVQLTEELTEKLKGQVDQAQTLSLPLTQPLDASTLDTSTVDTLSAITWPTTPVTTLIPTLNPSTLFTPSTYLLIGLAGSIGQSLAEWMLAHGAGCVILASRTPKVDPRWLASFSGAVRIFSVDVTDLSAVEALVKKIRETADIPPIAGVANGAMVLHDALFSNMTPAQMHTVLRPKITGSYNLDRAFASDDLEFFILFSSVICVSGNSGQANYGAANGYVQSLARQRRRRGLAASALDVGRVVGVGYVETAGETVAGQLERMGLDTLSEGDLRVAFGEAILAGRLPVTGTAGEEEEESGNGIVTTGIRNIRRDEDIRGPWFSNPLFAHCIVDAIDAVDARAGNDKEGPALPVSQQLARATTAEEGLEVLVSCFEARLRVILQIFDGELDRDAPLVQLGIDSLVAVEARSWFLKELKVDMPVLKLVGGASVKEVCLLAWEKLPEGLVGSLGEANVNKETVAVATERGPETERGSKDLGSTTRSPSDAGTMDDSEDVTRLASSATTPATVSEAGDEPETVLKQTEAETKTDTKAETRTIETLPVETKTVTLNEKDKTPISLSQSRFWFLHHLLADPSTYNVTLHYHITGPLRIPDLARAVRTVTARHEALRTAFLADPTDPSQAYQKVLPTSLVRLDHRPLSSPSDLDAEYARLQSHPFDLASGDLMQLVLLSDGPTSHHLLINYHHIIMDGVSLQVFFTDLDKAYTHRPLGPRPPQYPALSTAQRTAYTSGAFATDLAYWRSVFPADDPPPVLPLLPMAKGNARLAMGLFDTHQVSRRLEGGLVGKVKALARAQRATPFHLYLAAFKVLLFALLPETTDLTIGIADAARHEDAVMGSIGFFLNLLPLRFRRGGAPANDKGEGKKKQTLAEAVSEARDTVYAALGASRVPFDVLLTELGVERSAGHSPFFQAFLDYRLGSQEKHSFGSSGTGKEGECEFELTRARPGRTAYDVTLDVMENAADALVVVRMQKGLYEEGAAGLVLDLFVKVVEQMVGNSEAEGVDLLGGVVDKVGETVGRGPALESNWPATLPHRIDAIAQTHPTKPAVQDDSRTLTYAEMTARIEAIAHTLKALPGFAPGARVLVFEQATADWVCSMLAIMRVGAVYVPLDLRNPLPRLAAVAKDCAPFAILADSVTVVDAPQLEVPDAHIVDVSTVPRQSEKPVPNESSADATAAILYTSGSTGTPKGIAVTHDGLRNEIEGYTKTWNLGAERTLQQSVFTFNHSSDQIYTGLVNGGTVYVVPSHLRGDPAEITRIMADHGITYTKATPSEYLLWIEHGAENLQKAGRSTWKFAFGGGESLTTSVPSGLAALELSPDFRFFNSYGPTEISISSHKVEIPYRDSASLSSVARIPCGFSLPNYHTYIVDPSDAVPARAYPPYMPGEVCIGGAGVSQGYLNNPELTDKHFVPNPFATAEDVSKGWTRMYRTGDIGHLTADGQLVFRHRIAGDTQVKIRGLRIDLRDVESNIVGESGGVLQEAVVTLRDEETGVLVAHVVFSPAQAAEWSESQKEAFLEGLLAKLPVPQYMIPVLAIPLAKLPLSAHAKVDRKAVRALPLPERQLKGSSEAESEELTPTMATLQTIWRAVLGAPVSGRAITPSTSFFHAGGNSLLAIRLQAQVKTHFRVVLRLMDILEAHTLRDMARKIEESAVEGLLDWERETALPDLDAVLADLPTLSEQTKKTGTTILVTGSTGFLARHILPHLAANPTITQIHCLAVRTPSKIPTLSSPALQAKLTIHPGDLTLPRLGLDAATFASLASQADGILHLGGGRSFWDHYHVLRGVNVNSTKEVVTLAAAAAGKNVPVVYISSVGVLPDGSDVAESAAANPPAVDGTNGYVASRWASERVLEKAGEAWGVKGVVVRFLPASSAAGTENTEEEVLKEFLHFARLSKTLPDSTGWHGRVDMSPAGEIASLLSDKLLALASSADKEGAKTDTEFVHLPSQSSVDVQALQVWLEERIGEVEGGKVERVPLVQWMGRIKRLGFGQLMTSQEVTVGGPGAGLESKR